MTKKQQIAVRLIEVAKRIGKGRVDKDTLRILGNSVVPALEAILDDRADYFAVLALGEDITIQDWSNTPDAPLYEVAGRLQRMGSEMALAAETFDHEAEPDCLVCDQTDCPNHGGPPKHSHETDPKLN